MLDVAILLSIGVSVAAFRHQLNSMHDHLIEHFERITHMSSAETIAAVVTKLDKARGEIVGLVSALREQIAAGVPAEQLDLTALEAAAQALDDIVPDEAPAVDPATEPTE